MRKVKVKFPTPRGPIAAAPSAHGGEFNLLIADDGAVAPFEVVGDFAVVDICGPLAQHTTLSMADGVLRILASYDVLRANCLAAFASSAKAVVLRLDSPGGDFAGCLELAATLREMARDANKRLIAFTDSSALSAAYAIACAADEIITTPSAFLGSIGVWAPLVDETAADAAKGIAIAIVASGTSKADRNPHVPMTADSIARLQAEVDGMADLFFRAVADLRGIPIEQVIALQGAQKFGETAVTLGLADRVVTSFDHLIQGVTTMPKFLDEAKASYRKSLAKRAQETDDEGKEAAAALAEFDDTEAKKSKKAEEDAEKEKAAASAGAAKAEGDNDGDEEAKAAAAKAEADEKEKEAKAAASANEAPTILGLAAQLHALQASIAAKDAAETRAKLLASRPDFSKEIRATLAAASTPLEAVRKACETWPKLASNTEVNLGALVPGATRGTHTEASGRVVHETEEEFIHRKMHPSQAAGVVEHKGRTTTLPFMSKADARAALAKIEEAKKGKA